MVQLDHGRKGDSMSSVPCMEGFSTQVRPDSIHFARHLVRKKRREPVPWSMPLEESHSRSLAREQSCGCWRVNRRACTSSVSACMEDLYVEHANPVTLEGCCESVALGVREAEEAEEEEGKEEGEEEREEGEEEERKLTDVTVLLVVYSAGGSATVLTGASAPAPFVPSSAFSIGAFTDSFAFSWGAVTPNSGIISDSTDTCKMAGSWVGLG
mmetsp:Transcript_33998/g.47103  ORF Transcript_33998/g.47103 Transcript_33998/m.47103 type:complete len:212 (+) Transcript_33998:947-1582(+)